MITNRHRWLSAGVALLLSAPNAVQAVGPRNVIICIGDGMGFAQVDAAGYYRFGDDYGRNGNRFAFQTLPYHARMTTQAANTTITDSAAAGTAMATGRKVNSGVVSRAVPGDGGELETFLEWSRQRGKRTGLVTTTFISHATPATFGAHNLSRYNYTAIISDYLDRTQPDLLFGGAAHVVAAQVQQAGYTVVADRAALLALDTTESVRVWGMFGTNNLPYEYDGLGILPHLTDMSTVAIDLLAAGPDGFFMMLEGGRIDHAGHANDIVRLIHEVIAFDRAVQTVLDWAQGRDDTLIIVTADHETGGLRVLAHGGPGMVPTVRWTTTGHTAALVPVYADGVNASLVHGLLDNTDIARIMRCTQALPGDFNDDGNVTSADLAPMIACVTGPARRTCCDFDRDGDEDADDLGIWLTCLQGPAAPWLAACQDMDLAPSFAVDLADWAVLQAQWSSPLAGNLPAACAAADFDQDHDADLHDLGQFQDAMRP